MFTNENDRILFEQVVSKFNLTGLTRNDDTAHALRILFTMKPVLLVKISAELNDFSYARYTHGKRGTYSNHGCRGALCTHSNKMSTRGRLNLDRLSDGIDQALDSLCESHHLTKLQDEGF